MTALDIFIIILVIFGLVGTIAPALPGTAIILAAAVIHGAATEFSPIDGRFLLILALLTGIGAGGQYLIAGFGSKSMGSTRYGMIGAGVGMVIGLIFPIPGGIFMGTFLGAVACELIFGLKDLRLAAKAGVGALLGSLASLFFEFLIGLIMAGLIFHRLYGA
ncbi:MAG: DUF456 domain-containing protein [Proteobacteria bacterium]|nr:DUF456 domain-containing protein [Pseudomonadota bacterium]MBU1687919.1 DUF456 domain-containing protein [Pseudomonadota bacterium]